MAKFKRLDQRDNGLDAEALLAVLKAFTAGDYSVRLPTDWTGVHGQIAETVNECISARNVITDIVLRIFEKVGQAGLLDFRIVTAELQGRLLEVGESLNVMLSELIIPLNEMMQITNAVARGDLNQRVPIVINGKKKEGQFLIWAEMMNEMMSVLSTMVSEVSRVAYEAGTEGNFGEQATVLGVDGIWRELTERVNEMIRNLRDTTIRNSDQDWLKTNLAKLTRILQGERDLILVSKIVLSEIAPSVGALHGVFYVMDETYIDEPRLKMFSTYAYKERQNIAKEWKIGEGLVGQCAFEKERILLTDVPNDYIQITSGLGEAKPFNIIVLPIIFEGQVKAVIELASFTPYSEIQQAFLEQVAEAIGFVLNTIEASVRTMELLKQSHALTEELQSQQEELHVTNQELEEKAQLLEEQKLEVETKNREVEQAKIQVEEKASQLELTSKYKSEFLSNMSHELRTPLNSLLILAEHLAANPKDHLDAKEVEFAKMIHVSGNDLLSLINEILDLSKIESGIVSVNLAPVPFAAVYDQIEKTFRYVANHRELGFDVTFASDLPLAIVTDEMRLQQVVKNLLSNAFKFTQKGNVSIRVDRALSGWSAENESLNEANAVFAFTVTDTGIGISADKQRIIFEAFQQADSRTARKYGGTGLGLSISREIARLLGGELKLVQSTLQQGSTFSLFVPNGKIGKTILDPTLESEAHSPINQRPKLDATHEPDRILDATLPELDVVDDRDVTRQDGPVLLTSDLSGKKVLIVDDDERNIIALTVVLERKGAIVLSKKNGRGAIDLLERTLDIDLVLMDIMMPEMDGYETMRKIRRSEKFKRLPIIALTAKAMVGDREKCIDAGASDYLSKPVNVEQLSAMMQVWLS